jgi:hypothetical protein
MRLRSLRYAGVRAQLYAGAVVGQAGLTAIGSAYWPHGMRFTAQCARAPEFATLSNSDVFNEMGQLNPERDAAGVARTVKWIYFLSLEQIRASPSWRK